MITPPKITRAAAIQKGSLVRLEGRMLKVVRVTGSDLAAPVILEELTATGDALAGQLSLWSHDGVARALFKIGKLAK